MTKKKKTREEKQKEKDKKNQPEWMKTNDTEKLSGMVSDIETKIETLKKNGLPDDDINIIMLKTKKENIETKIKRIFGVS